MNKQLSPLSIGVDTGGTFTDFVALDPVTGRLRVHKLRSNPADPASVILAGINELTRLTAGRPAEITHGSTVATNAVLERKGARIALITTAGYEDVLRIGRQTRPELYNFLVAARRPLVDPALTFGIPERLAHDGTILQALRDLPASQPVQNSHAERISSPIAERSPGACPEPADPITTIPDCPPPSTDAFPNLIATLCAAQVESVAVCLLHSYANPVHEQILTRALTAAGFLVSASHAILPEYREYERWSTTAVNAYVTPLMSTYLSRLAKALDTTPAQRADSVPMSRSLTAPEWDPSTAPVTKLRIMQSNGGSISAAHAASAAVQTILSGPAAGVVGAQTLARASGFERIIAFDMGGTSTDVSLLDGHIRTTNESLVGDLPVRLPVLDIHTVGAGGGSIAWLDSGGALRVGPRSAGANPGPACYGQGTELTVTDANLLLGRLDPAHFLGGRMPLDLAHTQAIAEAFAARLGLTVQALAEGIVRIANANMERAIRVVSIERGHDPRDFALVAFGGAGGLHACALADSLDIPTVLIPEHSGVLSALGMLAADVIRDYSASILRATSSLSFATLEASLEPLMTRATEELSHEGFPADRITLSPSVDMRYRGQAYEIPIPLTPDFASAFHQAHQKLYGYANPTRPTEIVQLRLKAIAQTNKPSFAPAKPAAPDPESAKLCHPERSSSQSEERSRRTQTLSTSPQPSPLSDSDLPTPATTRLTIFNATPHLTPIYHRDQLTAGMQAPGPAILLTGQSTTIIPPTWQWHLDPIGTLIATRL